MVQCNILEFPMETHIPRSLAVVFFVGSLAAGFFGLAGVFIADQMLDRRNTDFARKLSFNLSFESLIAELTAGA
jgi:hypothetical protein